MGKPIVFRHGHTDSWFSFSRLLPLLPPRYHAFAFDQRPTTIDGGIPPPEAAAGETG